MPKSPQAPTKAPAQVSAVTADGVQKKTGPTFAGNPPLRPNPPDRGSTGPISNQRQPAPRGPVTTGPGGGVYANAQQPIDK